MSTRVIDAARVQRLNDRDPRGGRYTLYWMQQSQRAECNHALEFAIQRANDNADRLLVAFGLTAGYPDANLRHFRFLLEGLRETADQLRRRKIRFVCRLGDPAEVALSLATDASEVICDRGYLRHQRQWREQVAADAPCRVWQVESDAIVPVEVASDKQEYAARTIRPKLHRAAPEYLVDLTTTALGKDSRRLSVDGEDLADIDAVLQRLDIDREVAPVTTLCGGTNAARRQLQAFIGQRLSRYGERGALIDGPVSRLSPYLHFGQISPLAVALAIRDARPAGDERRENFIEELLVRRELSINFVHYCKDYDSPACLPSWASQTLAEHEDDEREHVYTRSQLEDARTHDPAWNAAMLEMKHGGYLHNHLRMYWGKKILQWTNTTGHAYRTALALNNRYFLDGRDPNSYASIAWLFGLHDRAHQERAVFGKIRYMSAAGLRRKFDVEGYIEGIAQRCGVAIEGRDGDA